MLTRTADCSIFNDLAALSIDWIYGYLIFEFYIFQVDSPT